jgi:hypothetical protein
MQRTLNAFVVVVAVSAAPTKLAKSRNTQRKHSISLSAVSAL